MKKLLSLTLALLMTAGTVLTLASCADNGKGNNTSAQGNGTVDPNRIYLDDLPDNLDFDGATITIAYCEGDDGPFTQRSLDVDPDSQDSVDSALFERNKSVEARLNVTLDPVKMNDICNNACMDALLAGDDTYDIIAGYQFYDLRMALQGVMVNFNEMEKYDAAGYINTSKDYWAGDYVDGITYKNNKFWLTGDLALRYLGGMFCTYVNSTIYNNILNAKYGSIYDIVKDGKWDLDTMHEMASLAYLDTNTNDMTDPDDRLGYVTIRSCVLYSMAISAGVNFSVKDSDGNVSLALNSKTSVSYAEKVARYFKSNYTYVDKSYPDELSLYAGGNILFVNNKVHQAEIYFQDMKDDYYVIPCPKLTVDQPNYITYIHNGCTIFGISASSDCIDASAATLEALCSESSRLAKSVYYDKALKFGYTRDPEAAEMIDLMRDTVRGDFALAWSLSVNAISEIFHQSENNRFASSLARAMNTYQSALDKLIADLEELD